MTQTQRYTPSHEPHPWTELTPEQVLDEVVHDLYSPLSALSSEVDRLSTGAFADDDLGVLLAQIRDRIDDLSRVVVAVKRYQAERGQR
ncbi:MAG: hypothetical protein RLZZ387_1051 [Chloroflexota bacterium]|jgi:K+-sensing histidine kinase KdpD